MNLTKTFICDVCGKKYTGYRYTPEYVEKLIGSKCAVCITDEDTDKIEGLLKNKKSPIGILKEIKKGNFKINFDIDEKTSDGKINKVTLKSISLIKP